MLLKILIFAKTFFSLLAAATLSYDCSTKDTVYLGLNEIAFFETTGYPKLMDLIFEWPSCNFTLTLKNGLPQNNVKIFVVLTVIYHSGLYKGFPSSFIYKDGFKYSMLDFHTSDDEDSIAAQGFILFDDEANNAHYCPLELICKEKPFEIIDETQIIHIRTSYVENQRRIKPCFWQFSTLEGFGFKIVIQKFDVSCNTTLRITNTTDLILTEKSVKTFYAYYNSDQFLFIHLSEGDTNFVTEMQFQAYISVVKKNSEKIDGNCTFNRLNEVHTTWNYIQYNGYQNNVFCDANITIPASTVLYVVVDHDYTDLEIGIDYIQYFEGWNYFVLHEKYVDYLIIWPYENGTEKITLWKFVSDGNIVFRGFKLDFYFFSYECSKVIPKCDDYSNYLMDIYFKDYFFGHLSCNFTIPSCYPEMTLFSLSVNSAFDAPQNTFIVFSDDEKVFEINHLNVDNDRGVTLIFCHSKNTEIFLTFEILLNSSKNNIFQAITFPSHFVQRLTFWIDSNKIPNITNNIVKENTYLIAENLFPNYTYISFEMSKPQKNNNTMFEIYCAYPKALSLYKDENLDSLANCLYDLNKYRCTLNQTKFVLHYLFSQNEFAVVRQSVKIRGCIFNEHFYIINYPEGKEVQKFPIATIADYEEDECQIVVIINDHNTYQFTHLWTTSKNENVKVYIGAEETAFFFEFNSETAKKLKNIVASSNVYTIKIPNGQSLYILIENIIVDEIIVTNPIFTFDEYPVNSFLITASYGCTRVHSVPDNVIYVIKNYPVMFTAIDYYVRYERDIYFLFDNGTRLYFEEVGESVIFQNQNITIYQNPIPARAIFFIQSLHDIDLKTIC